LREDIDILDSKISRLKVEYEQYFLRILKREPVRLREEIDRMVLRYSSVPITNTALKFRFSSIVSRYNSYKQYWARTIRAINEGTYRKRPETGGAEVAPCNQDSRPLSAEARHGAPQGLDGDDRLKKTYHEFIDARKACGEPTRGISFERFKRAIEDQRRRLLEKGGVKDVDLRVRTKDGKVRVALIPLGTDNKKY